MAIRFLITHHYFSNDSVLALKLRNVTKQDVGVCMSIARNILSYHSDQIELNVTEPSADSKHHTT